jgi:hypothetical protein
VGLFVQASSTYAQQNTNVSAVDNFMSGGTQAPQASSSTATNPLKNKTLNNKKTNVASSATPVTTVVIPPRVASQTSTTASATSLAATPVATSASQVAHAPVPVVATSASVPASLSDAQVTPRVNVNSDNNDNTVKNSEALKTANIKENEHTNKNANSKAEDCVTPVVHKKTVHHVIHKKIVVKKSYTSIPVTTSTRVNSIDMQAPINLQAAYLTSSDIDVQITHPEKKIFAVSFVNKTTGEAVPHDQFVQLIDGSDFSAHSLDSRLTYIKAFNADSDDKTTVFRFEDKKAGDCTGFYFTYHLKGDTDITTRHIFVGSNGEILNKSDGSCKLVQKHPRDVFGYNDDNYVTTLNWNDSFNSSDKPVRFQVMVTKDSQELFPQNLSAYAVSTDFSDFNYTLGKMDKRGPYFGSAFNMSLPANSYFMNISYEYDNGNKTELISVPTIVQQASK